MQYTKAVDTGNCSARIFFADFSKRFDIIDHNILLQQLSSLDIDTTLYIWIKAFLTNRTQAVRVGSSLSPWTHTHGGVPQGTQLGTTLFAIMINDLLKNWHLRTKYDDTTVSEILPRNSISLLDFAVRDIHDYCTEHKMKLKPKKCKEMVFNFMKNLITVTRPLHIENPEVERVSTSRTFRAAI